MKILYGVAYEGYELLHFQLLIRKERYGKIVQQTISKASRLSKLKSAGC